jgi:hypothetical protein
MASKRNVRPGSAGGNDLLNAIRRLEAVRAAGLQDLAREVDELLECLYEAGVPTADTEPTAIGLGEALDAGLHPKRQQKGRHDAARPPAGWVYERGRLWLAELPRGFGEGDGYTPEQKEIATVIADEARSWASDFVVGPDGPELLAIFERIFGYPWGCEWQKALELELEEDALFRREATMREATGEPPRYEVEDDELLQRVHARVCGQGSCGMPEDLTLETIRRLRDETSVGGGGKTKTAAGTVAAFLKRRSGNS